MASDSNEASSIYSSTATETSASTVYGLGYLSGRAIKRLGEAVLNGVDYIFINHQLRRMETYFAGEWREKGKETKEMCGLLLEFTHPGYVPSVRMRAFRLIMYQIGDSRVKGLVSALVETQSISTRYRHLTEVRDCIASIQASNHETAEDSSSRFEKARAYLRAGRESYLRDAKHRPAFQLRRESLYIPALLYFTAISAHNAKENARLVLATDTIGFLRFLGLFKPSTADLGVVAGTRGYTTCTVHPLLTTYTTHLYLHHMRFRCTRFLKIHHFDIEEGGVGWQLPIQDVAKAKPRLEPARL
ncbi:hypothetical protein PM082_018259 [Marasmius tenuissimus]|nr:hypothetical protein PM082_018259 [Marasmius tenuissimus]